MLVLRRRVQERILVADEIEVLVVRIEGDRVVLGITAPRDVNIRRAELPPREPVAEAARFGHVGVHASACPPARTR